jgi:hypothetical protein
MISSDRIARLPEFGERARGSVWALSRFPLVAGARVRYRPGTAGRSVRLGGVVNDHHNDHSDAQHVDENHPRLAVKGSNRRRRLGSRGLVGHCRGVLSWPD